MIQKYRTNQGDTWDMISFIVYGDEHYVDILIKANPLYMGVAIFPANIELTIPHIELDPINTLPPWKRSTT